MRVTVGLVLGLAISFQALALDLGHALLAPVFHESEFEC